VVSWSRKKVLKCAQDLPALVSDDDDDNGNENGSLDGSARAQEQDFSFDMDITNFRGALPETLCVITVRVVSCMLSIGFHCITIISSMQ
jgi:hypothetical protein